MASPLTFLGIFGLFFILWLVGGGPTKPISFSGPYLNPITGPGQTAQPYGDPNDYSPINSTIGVGSGGVSVTGGTGASSYEGSVTLSRDISGTAATDAKSEYVVIRNSSWGGKDVSLSGWKLAGAAGTVALPQGTDVARSGRVNQIAPITLRPGEEAIIVTGRSPIGISFRENKCTGYLEEHQDFRPALSLSCPTAWQEYERNFDGEEEECERFVQTIPYCSAETDVPSNVSSSCRRFTEQYLDHNACVAEHANDDGFRSSTWRLFLGRSEELWPRTKGTITLLDAEGKIVDSIKY